MTYLLGVVSFILGCIAIGLGKNSTIGFSIGLILIWLSGYLAGGGI